MLERPRYISNAIILNDLFSGHHDLVPYKEQTREIELQNIQMEHEFQEGSR